MSPSPSLRRQAVRLRLSLTVGRCSLRGLNFVTGILLVGLGYYTWGVVNVAVAVRWTPFQRPAPPFALDPYIAMLIGIGSDHAGYAYKTWMID